MGRNHASRSLEKALGRGGKWSLMRMSLEARPWLTEVLVEMTAGRSGWTPTYQPERNLVAGRVDASASTELRRTRSK